MPAMEHCHEREEESDRGRRTRPARHRHDRARGEGSDPATDPDRRRIPAPGLGTDRQVVTRQLWTRRTPAFLANEPSGAAFFGRPTLRNPDPSRGGIVATQSSGHGT